MKISIIILTILCFFPHRAGAQEDSISLKKDSLITDFVIEYNTPGLVPYSTNFERLEFQSSLLPLEVESIDMKLQSFFSTPPYYTNPSRMFYGDYSTSGKLLPHLYGSGFQSTLPGVGRINNASLLYQYDLNKYFEFRGGVSVTKFNNEQIFNASGMLTYHSNEKLRISFFGSYAPANLYGIHETSYGAIVGYDFSDRFGMGVGVQRHYDPMRRQWQTIPIAIPYYKFDKFELGIDVGGIIYEILRNVIEDKRESQFPAMIPPRR